MFQDMMMMMYVKQKQERVRWSDEQSPILDWTNLAEDQRKRSGNRSSGDQRYKTCVALTFAL